MKDLEKQYDERKAAILLTGAVLAGDMFQFIGSDWPCMFSVSQIKIADDKSWKRILGYYQKGANYLLTKNL